MPPLRREVRATLTLALPMIVTQVGQIAMVTTDIAFVGRLGSDALAAVGMGAALFTAVIFMALGIVMATGGLAAQAHGAGDAEALSDVTGQGLLVALLLTVPVGAVACFGEGILLALGQEPRLAALASGYLVALAWGSPTMLGFVVLRSFFGAFNRPWPPFVAVLITIPLNGLIDWLLIYGKFGLPELGVVGAGVATAISATASFVLLLVHGLRHKAYGGYRILAHILPARPARISEIVRIGIPIGLALVMETGLFGSAMFMMGWIDSAHAAAHQVAIQVISILFMVPIGIGQAATVRVGNEIGRGDMAAARRAGWVAIQLGVAFMAGSALLIGYAPEPFARLFVDGATPDGERVVAIAASLLVAAAIFQIMDGIQAIGGFALRGLNDTRVPMIFTTFGYWGLGLTSSYVLGFVFGFGGVGIWYGFTLGIGATAVLNLVRFAWLTRPDARPLHRVALSRMKG